MLPDKDTTEIFGTDIGGTVTDVGTESQTGRIRGMTADCYITLLKLRKTEKHT